MQFLTSRNWSLDYIEMSEMKNKKLTKARSDYIEMSEM